MAITVTRMVHGIRRERDIASTHAVYILDGMREIHDCGVFLVDACSPGSATG